MFYRLGRLTVSYPWTICAVWLLLGAGLALIAPHWDTRTQDDDIRFIPERFTSVRAYQILEKAFPQDVFASNLILAVEREDGSLTPADFALVDRIVAALEKLRKQAPELKFGKIDSYQDPLIGGRLNSGDQQCTLIKVALGTPYLAVNTQVAVERAQDVVQGIVRDAGEGAARVYVTGSAGIGAGITRACGDSLDNTTGATVLLVIVVLLLVYRAPLLALIPLVSIAVSVWVALNLLALLTLLPGVHLVNISKIFAIVILYGAGTDYCLFLISRYREELLGGRAKANAIATAVGGVGEALAASAGTVMVGLGLMALAEFAKVRYAGPAIALSLGVALIGSLTLTPALLQLLGRAAFWPRPVPSAPRLRLQRPLAREKFNFWDWISHGVARRPLLVWSVSVAVLLPLVILGLRVQANYRATAELPPSSESLQGLAAIQRHFTAGEIGPVTVLLVSDTPWDNADGLLQIDHLSRGFARMDNIAEIRSLTQPLGVHLPILAVDSEGRGPVNWFLRTVQPAIAQLQERMIASGKPHYTAEILVNSPDAVVGLSASGAESPGGDASASVKKHVTRLDVVLKSDPFDTASAATVLMLQAWLRDELGRSPIVPGRVQTEFYGITANTMDLAEVTESDRHRVNVLVLGAIFLILLVLVRKLWLAAYLLVTVLFSYFAALGATVLVGIFWTGQPLPHVDWRVPFFLFTILVAVGEDYNILLVNRAMQERKRFGLIEGMRRALAKTGGAITSCGIIMAGTFATLMLAGLGTLTQIGFALAFGVLVDTFLVRPFLVPAFTILCWRLRGHRDIEVEPAQPEYVTRAAA
jgi:RND superfamily putative drug exporter